MSQLYSSSLQPEHHIAHPNILQTQEKNHSIMAPRTRGKQAVQEEFEEGTPIQWEQVEMLVNVTSGSSKQKMVRGILK